MTDAHAKAKGGRVPAFAGYATEQEERLWRAAKWHLMGLVDREREFMSFELAAVVDPKARKLLQLRQLNARNAALLAASTADQSGALSAEEEWDDREESGTWQISAKACIFVSRQATLPPHPQTTSQPSLWWWLTLLRRRGVRGGGGSAAEVGSQRQQRRKCYVIGDVGDVHGAEGPAGGAAAGCSSEPGGGR
eukprot:6197421-Pleurochrysis_carterae.AAC.1